MSVNTMIKKSTSPFPKETAAWVPYTMPLPDGRTVFVRVPGRMVEYDRGGEMMFTPEGGRFLDRIQVMAMRTPSAPSPGYIKTVREALGLTQPAFAKALGRSTVSVKKYEAGDARPGKDVVQRLRHLVDKAAGQGVVLAG